MAHVAKSYGEVPARRRRSRSRLGLTGVLSMFALAVVAGGLIGVVVFEGVRLLLGVLY